MIRSRLAKLERLARDVNANCPGCLRIRPLILLPDVKGPAATDGGTDPPELDTTAVCEVCGSVHERTVIRIVTPGLKAPLVPLD